MKLTKSKLERLIKEELSNILKEGDAEMEAELFIDKLQKMTSAQRNEMDEVGVMEIYNQAWDVGRGVRSGLKHGIAGAMKNFDEHAPKEITDLPNVREVFRSTMESLRGKESVTRRSELRPDDPLSTAGRYQ